MDLESVSKATCIKNNLLLSFHPPFLDTWCIGLAMPHWYPPLHHPSRAKVGSCWKIDDAPDKPSYVKFTWFARLVEKVASWGGDTGRENKEFIWKARHKRFPVRLSRGERGGGRRFPNLLKRRRRGIRTDLYYTLTRTRCLELLPLPSRSHVSPLPEESKSKIFKSSVDARAKSVPRWLLPHVRHLHTFRTYVNVYQGA